MFISQLHLKNFKRFSDLTIDLTAPTPPKLVLLIGANGSGKSCVFDAFEWANSERPARTYPPPDEVSYYAKNGRAAAEVIASFTDGTQLKTDLNHIFNNRQNGILYGRSSLRQLPQLTRIRRGAPVDVVKDSDRPLRYIDRDERFENDIDLITGRILDEVFGGNDFNAADLRGRYIEPLNEALGRIFGTDPATSIVLREFTPPLSERIADIRFRKGVSDIHYNLLSSGEKEILNILLNLFVRKQFFPDSVYFIDELDLHLNTALQSTLLKEIVEHWIPEGCQLWTASHSLGFIEYAQASPEAAIVDFDQFDFDRPIRLTAKPKSDLDIVEVAVPRSSLANIFRDRLITYCENKDAALYNLLDLGKRVFLPARDKNDVYFMAKNNPQVQGLMDRDYITDDELAELREKVPNLRVLGYYCFENYLYHPDNVSEAYPGYDSAAYRANIVEQKGTLLQDVLLYLQSSRGGYKALVSEGIHDHQGKRRDAGMKVVAERLKSDEFEVFYQFLDMNKVSLSLLAPLKFSEKRLAQTAWFRQQIEAVLK